MRCLSVLLFCEAAAAAVQEKDDGPKGRIRLNSSSFCHSKWKPILQHPKWRIPNVCTTTTSSNQSTRSKRRATIQSLLSPKSHYCSAKLSIHSFCWTSTPAVQILLLTNAIRETDKYSNCHVSQSVTPCCSTSHSILDGWMDWWLVWLVGWPGKYPYSSSGYYYKNVMGIIINSPPFSLLGCTCRCSGKTMSIQFSSTFNSSYWS